MRLLDQVAQASRPVLISGSSGSHVLPSTRDRAVTVQECPLRFVLDGNASDKCGILLTTDYDMLVG